MWHVCLGNVCIGVGVVVVAVVLVAVICFVFVLLRGVSAVFIYVACVGRCTCLVL